MSNEQDQTKSAPTTEEVREALDDEHTGAYTAGKMAGLRYYALPIAEHRDALAAEVARRGDLLAAERERYVLIQGTLDAERRASTERSAAHMEEVARLKAQLASTDESIRAIQAKNDHREGGHGCGCGGY